MKSTEEMLVSQDEFFLYLGLPDFAKKKIELQIKDE